MILICVSTFFRRVEEADMTLASLLKQKSKSINIDRLKNAAKVKQAEREKAARIAEREARLKANEVARKERVKEKEKKRQVEQKRLIKWLAPGLLLAWNKEDYIEYNPRTVEEIATAKKYFGFTSKSSDISSLNYELRNLEIEIKVLHNRFANLQEYSLNQMPSVIFDIEIVLHSFKKQELLFSKAWQRNFLREAIRFEKSAFKNYSAQLTEHAAIEKKKLDAKKGYVRVDRDILQVTGLAETLRPRINTFRSQYWALLNSPSSIHLIHYGRNAFESVNFAELVASRDYQLSVARYVLNEMKIFCDITLPDITGKYMAAFGVASGEDLHEALDKHITDPELKERFEDYWLVFNANSKSQSEIRLPKLDVQNVVDIVNSTFESVEKVAKNLVNLDIQYLKINNGLVSFRPSLIIDNLSETALYPEVDRLAYDIQWLRSSSGQKFKTQFTNYLDEIAGNGKYSAKLKIFSVDDGMLIELPSGKEIQCDMVWESFEQLMKFLELEITETTSTGLVKFKWG